MNKGLLLAVCLLFSLTCHASVNPQNGELNGEWEYFNENTLMCSFDDEGFGTYEELAEYQKPPIFLTINKTEIELKTVYTDLKCAIIEKGQIAIDQNDGLRFEFDPSKALSNCPTKIKGYSFILNKTMAVHADLSNNKKTLGLSAPQSTQHSYCGTQYWKRPELVM